MNFRDKRLFFTSAAVVAVLACSGYGVAVETGNVATAGTEIVVFAAASTTNAVTEIGALYKSRGLGFITPVFASSSTLAKQIENGAPVDIYISADKRWMDHLEGKHLLIQKSRFDLFSNRIVLITPMDSTIEKIDVVPGFSLDAVLGKDGRLSMGDPDHVPAGTYGREALKSMGSWDSLKDRIAPMKDVRAALVMVERGESPLGVVYATDAIISRKVRVVGTFPADSHPPIVYPVAAVATGKRDEAGKFLTFLKSSEAHTVFIKHGFDVE